MWVLYDLLILVGQLLRAIPRALARNWPVVLGIILIGGGTTALTAYCDAPWALPWRGDASPLGQWFGLLQSKQGRTHPLLLDLGVNITSESGVSIKGTARLCLMGGRETRVRVTGTGNRDGTRLNATGYELDGRVMPRALGLGAIWNGDTLTVSGSNPFDPAGNLWTPRTWLAAQASFDDDFVPSVLHRGGEAEFRRACESH